MTKFIENNWFKICILLLLTFLTLILVKYLNSGSRMNNVGIIKANQTEEARNNCIKESEKHYENATTVNNFSYQSCPTATYDSLGERYRLFSDRECLERYAQGMERIKTNQEKEVNTCWERYPIK